MIASTLPHCHKSLSRITARSCLLKSRSPVVLRCINPRRSVFTLRPISHLPISEKEMIQRLEKSLQCTQIHFYLSGIVLTACLFITSLRLKWIDEAFQDLDDGFRDAGNLLASELQGLKNMK